MTSKVSMEAADRIDMERRIIRVEHLPDQAGIAAALRRAFTAGPKPEEVDDDPFAELLKLIH